MNTIRDQIREAAQAIKEGNRTKARGILRDIVSREPNNELAWLWLSVAMEDTAKRAQCLEKVLTINPNNAKAKTALARLRPDEPDLDDLLSGIAQSRHAKAEDDSKKKEHPYAEALSTIAVICGAVGLLVFPLVLGILALLFGLLAVAFGRRGGFWGVGLGILDILFYFVNLAYVFNTLF